MPDTIATGQNPNNPASGVNNPDPSATEPTTDGAKIDTRPADNAGGNADQKPTGTTTQLNPADNASAQKDSQAAAKETDSLLDAPQDEPNKGEPNQGEENPVLGAPEDGYQFEGTDMTDAAVGAFANVAKELNLSQESASKIFSTSLAGMKEQMLKQRADLYQQSVTNKELGLDDAVARQAVQQTYRRFFGDKPSLQAKIRAVNLDVDPEFIGVMKRISAELSEGTFVNGQRQGATDKSDFRTLFPNTKMNR